MLLQANQALKIGEMISTVQNEEEEDGAPCGHTLSITLTITTFLLFTFSLTDYVSVCVWLPVSPGNSIDGECEQQQQENNHSLPYLSLPDYY